MIIPTDSVYHTCKAPYPAHSSPYTYLSHLQSSLSRPFFTVYFSITLAKLTIPPILNRILLYHACTAPYPAHSSPYTYLSHLQSSLSRPFFTVYFSITLAKLTIPPILNRILLYHACTAPYPAHSSPYTYLSHLQSSLSRPFFTVYFSITLVQLPIPPILHCALLYCTCPPSNLWFVFTIARWSLDHSRAADT